MTKHRIIPFIAGSIVLFAGLALIIMFDGYIITVIGLIVVWISWTCFKVALKGSDELIVNMCTTDTKSDIDDQSKYELTELLNIKHRTSIDPPKTMEHGEKVSINTDNSKYDNIAEAVLEILIYNASETVKAIASKDDELLFRYKKWQKLHEDISCCYIAIFLLMMGSDMSINDHEDLDNSIKECFALYLNEFYSETMEESDIINVDKQDILCKLRHYNDMISHAKNNDVAVLSMTCATNINNLLIMRPYMLRKEDSEISDLLTNTFPVNDINIIHKRIFDIT